MFKRIAVPLDGSKLAERAIPVAMAVAEKTGAEVRLLRVHVPIALRSTDPVVLPGDPLDKDVERHEREYAENLAQALSRSAKVDIGAATVRMRSSIPDTITKWASGQKVDGIVMCTHGEFGPGYPWLGSVADGVLRTSSLPVLLVDSSYSPPAGGFGVRAVTVPLDGSLLSESALDLAVPLARKLGADVELLRVVPKYAEPAMTELIRLATEYLESVEKRVAKTLPGVSAKVVVSIHAAKAILEHAAASPGRLVAMTTRGRGGLRRLLLGSVADKVARGSKVPVLLMQPAAPKKKARGKR